MIDVSSDSEEETPSPGVPVKKAETKANPAPKKGTQVSPAPKFDKSRSGLLEQVRCVDLNEM